jgi:hypothetical protein
MRRAAFMLAIVAVLGVPMMAAAETGQKRASESPTPCADADTAVIVEGRTLVASTTTLACQANQQKIGYCPENKPYFHVFSYTCHATLPDCKKQDGDAAHVPGNGGCILCGRYR